MVKCGQNLGKFALWQNLDGDRSSSTGHILSPLLALFLYCPSHLAFINFHAVSSRLTQRECQQDTGRHVQHGVSLGTPEKVYVCRKEY